MSRLIVALVTVTVFCSCKSTYQPAVDSAFTSTTIDIGLVVRDAEASVKFYRDVIGMKQVKTLDMPKSIIGDAGLVDYKESTIYLMALSDGKRATQLKIMSFPGKTATPANDYVDSSYGFSYITIFVKDGDKVLANLKKHNIKVLGKGPSSFAKLNFAPNFLIAVKDPDGNFIELIGPMK